MRISSNNKCVVIILMKDEILHIERCLHALKNLKCDVLVVDSGSSDGSVEKARLLGATVVYNPWKNYASQFNFAISQCIGPCWVLRLDADEVVSDELVAFTNRWVENPEPGVAGVSFDRSMCFLGRKVSRGGCFPIRVIRLFKNGSGVCEDRWMDEHIAVSGRVKHGLGEIIDDNKKSLEWWLLKHEKYASREAVDFLVKKYRHNVDKTSVEEIGQQARVKRFVKNNLYDHLPLLFRAMLYGFYRLVLRGGIFGSKESISFHILQGFWYRFLVDLKIAQVERHIKIHGTGDITKSIKEILGLNTR